jgi:DNA-binding IclR family transcriptional regulator
MLGTVARAAAVLDLFTVAEPEWGATGVAGELGIAKSQAHELLQTLAETGLLERRPSGRYQLGWRVAALHAVLARSSNVKRAAQGILRNLALRHHATIHLATWDRDRVIYIDKRTDPGATPTPTSAVGTRLHGHGSAVGKQLLAGRSGDELHEMLGDGRLEVFTPLTLATTEELAVELEEVRRDGVAYDRGETAADIRCVSAPLRDPEGELVAALSISMDVARWPRRSDPLAHAVLDAAEEIEHRMRERRAASVSRGAES